MPTPRVIAVTTMGATVVAAVALASYAAVELHAVELAGLLARHHAVPYAAGLWWVLVAPAPLLAAGLLVRWTPWPWVATCTLHLAVLVAVTARLRHLVPPGVLLGVGVVVLVGLAASVAAVAPDRGVPRRVPGG